MFDKPYHQNKQLQQEKISIYLPTYNWHLYLKTPQNKLCIKDTFKRQTKFSNPMIEVQV